MAASFFDIVHIYYYTGFSEGLVAEHKTNTINNPIFLFIRSVRQKVSVLFLILFVYGSCYFIAHEKTSMRTTTGCLFVCTAVKGSSILCTAVLAVCSHNSSSVCSKTMLSLRLLVGGVLCSY